MELDAIPGCPPTATALGRYKLETVLGSGGMGLVYRAWDPQLARPLAIKVVKQAGADDVNRARLVREAQSLARLSHPHVCHVYDVGSEGDEVWIAMELIDGATLRTWAGEHDRAELLGVLLDAAEGIAAAHAAGLIHRDVKPENVLVTRDGRAIVTDFGLARVDLPIDPAGSTMSLDPQMTATGAVVGTPAYLAPEQLTGGILDARVDQFAWAVMAWELLTGMRPFPILAAARLDAIRTGLTPPPTLAKPIATALLRALQLAPRDRFASMTELIAAIREAKSPARRTSSRRVPLIAAGAALLVAGVAVAAVKLAGSSAPAAAPVVADAALSAPLVAQSMASSPAPVPAVATVVTDVAPAPVTRTAAVVKPPSPKRAPPTKVEALTTGREPPPVIGSSRGGLSFSRGRATSVIAEMCRIPIDAAHPDPKLARPVTDWGKVTRRELVTGTFGDRPEQMLLYEVVGQRATYHFDGDAWNESIGQFDAKIGELVVVCSDNTSELFKFPGSWRGPLQVMLAMLPIAAPPRTAELTRLDPLHVPERVIARDGRAGKITIDRDRNYLVRAKIVAAEGDRWEMDNWWLEVPASVKGANLVKEGARLWLVVGEPLLVDQPDGGKPRLVMRAAAVLDTLFPE